MAKESTSVNDQVLKLIEQSYALGYEDGVKANSGQVMLPVVNIRMMSDEEWNHLAYQNRLQRQQAV